ncbi:major tail protein [Alkalihalobacterium alkalinitrilicum]|uniref:major tail protein n=1 Tax=Alkalihalobacterium alkalinitrilicum TaxID=427920 RepID=UPI000995C00C|nr:major tail protein [Alkalihalobacterium alkalinitrilicum]
MGLKGLKNLHYAVIESENEEETVYGTVKPLGPAMAFNIQPSVNRANLRADDKVLFSDTAKGPIAVTLNTAYLEKQVEADILGKTIHPNGLLSDNADDDAPYIAVGGQAENARGGYDFFWIYRVKFAPAEQNMETKQETPTYQTPSLTGEAIPRLHDGEEKLKAWNGDEAIDDSIFANWFNAVVDKNTVPEV